MPAQATPKPSVGRLTRAAVVDSVRITPDPASAIRRAAAVAVRNCVVVYVVIGSR
jgi:hypothetical protein